MPRALRREKRYRTATAVNARCRLVEVDTAVTTQSDGVHHFRVKWRCRRHAYGVLITRLTPAFHCRQPAQSSPDVIHEALLFNMLRLPRFAVTIIDACGVSVCHRHEELRNSRVGPQLSAASVLMEMISERSRICEARHRRRGDIAHEATETRINRCRRERRHTRDGSQRSGSSRSWAGS